MSRGARITRLAPAALVPPAVFAVHQLRFMLAFGGGAGVQLQRTGHSYLHSLAPWIMLLLGLAAGLFLQAVGRAMSGHTSLPRYSLSLLALWALCSGALLAIYASQELLEGLLATGHPAGLAGVLGYGGWWAIPVSIAIGLVVAATFHGARWVLEEVARRCAQPSRRARPSVAAACRADFFAPAPAPLAGGWSGRGPPG